MSLVGSLRGVQAVVDLVHVTVTVTVTAMQAALQSHFVKLSSPL